MTQIYLIRHAEAEGNSFRMMQGQIDLDLTEKGRRQIQALTSRFSDISINAVYSSDYYRAVETVNGICDSHGLNVRVDVRLRERNLGAWDGNFFGDLEYAYPEKMTTYKTAPCEWSVESCETYEEVTARMMDALAEICERHKDETVVIASHGVSIRCVMAHVMGLPVTHIGNVPIGDNTSVSKLCIDEDETYFEFKGDTSHLTDDALFSRKVESDLRSEQIPQEAWSELCGVSELNDQNAYEFLRERKNIVLKLLSGDTGVGTIILDALGDKDTEVIRYFYIMPQYRRRGFGTQMLGRAFRIGRSKAKRYVEIELPYDNQDVASFFEKNGFLLYGNGCAFNHTMRKEIKYFSQASMLPPI